MLRGRGTGDPKATLELEGRGEGKRNIENTNAYPPATNIICILSLRRFHRGQLRACESVCAPLEGRFTDGQELFGGLDWVRFRAGRLSVTECALLYARTHDRIE